MNINHLAIFHAVAEEGSVTRAAERLRISQPAVSKQLRELEKSLGVALFHRLSKGVKLTEGGELLAGYSRQLFALEAEAERALEELRGLERGRLCIGASTTIGTYFLPPILARFRVMHPRIEVQLLISNTREVQHQFLNNELDVALTEGSVPLPDLQADVFAHDEIVLIAPPRCALLCDVPVNLQGLSRFPIIAREAGSGSGAVIEASLAEKNFFLRPAMVLGSTEAIKRAVIAGAGFAFVSQRAVENEVAAGQLREVPLEDFSLKRPFHRLKLRGKYEGRAVREFVRLLRDEKLD